MFYSIAIIYFAALAHGFSPAALPLSYFGCSLATSQNQSEAQVHTNKVLPAGIVGENTSQFALGELSTYIKTCSPKGGEAQTPPQRQDKETTKDKSKITSQSSDEDDYTLDKSGCPELTKNVFYCFMCGGSDENGRCKGDLKYGNEYAGCSCNSDPDWSRNPPGLVRPGLRARKKARAAAKRAEARSAQARRLILDEDEEGIGRRGNLSSSGAAIVTDFHGDLAGPLNMAAVFVYHGSDSPKGVRQ